MSQSPNSFSSHSVGYCTNVHAGTNLESVKQNLLTHASAVKRRLGRSTPLPVGLWLSNEVAQELDSEKLIKWRDWLAQNEFVPYTINGFPFSNFHQDVVKHDVYLPTWAEESRLSYTLKLADILDAILPPGEIGTISTLPLGWPTANKSQDVSESDSQTVLASSRNFKRLAVALNRIAQKSGRVIKVCIEPEPGCLLDTATDVVSFFQEHLYDDSSTREIVQRHIGVCHDVCHSAVMFEAQRDAILAYRSAEIDVGKVQISSAVQLGCATKAGLEELAKFAEPRYLHQTVIHQSGENHFFEDLSFALARQDEFSDCSSWRVHFHVPIYLDQLGELGTTKSEIQECVEALQENQDRTMTHFEIETYAWNVLPKAHQESSLAAGIAKEIAWFESLGEVSF